MYEWMFFVHLAGLAAWFGVTLMGAMMLLSVKGKIADSGATSAAVSTIKNMNRVTHLAAVLVLVSGLYMILQWNRDSMPFWLRFMEQAGGMTVLLFIIVLAIMGSKLKKNLSQGDATSAAKRINVYTAWTFVFLVCILAVILVVSLKL